MAAETFYHVDRQGSLAANQAGGWNGSPYTFTLEKSEVLAKFFPAKLSPFGQRHVIQPSVDADGQGRPNPRWLERWGGRQALEYIWEHQRREVAPKALSRLEASFGCLDVESTRIFASDRYQRDGARWQSPTTRIWRLKAERGHVGDMNWLPWNAGLTGTSSAFTLADLTYCARRYWEGMPRNENPFWEVLLAGFWVEGLQEDYDASRGGTIVPLPFQD